MTDTELWMCQACGNTNGRGLTAIPWNCGRCGMARTTIVYPHWNGREVVQAPPAGAPVSVPSREPATPTRHSVENKAWADDLHRARVIESVAEIVYDAMRADNPEGALYRWMTGGNSDKQDEARGYARRILKAIQVDPERAPSAQAHNDIGQRHHREAVSGVRLPSPIDEASSPPAPPLASLEQRCDTTLTVRLPAIPGCCDTYPRNLGSCKTFLAGHADNDGRCVYCDHTEKCHPALASLGREESSEPRREEYFVARTAQKATPMRTETGDEWNVATRIHAAMYDRVPMHGDQATFALKCLGDLGEAEWRVRRDRDRLSDELTALRARCSSLEAEHGEADRVGDAHAMALEVLCRVFEDGADRGFDEWRAWYKPDQWLHAARALGAFIVTRLEKEREAARAEIAHLSSIEGLQAIVDDYAASARTIHLWLVEFCDESKRFPDMVADASQKAAAEIARLRSDLQQAQLMNGALEERMLAGRK